MKYEVKVVERMKKNVFVNARSETEAISKVEKRYYKDLIDCDELDGVTFCIKKEEETVKKFAERLKKRFENHKVLCDIVDEEMNKNDL